MQDTPKRSTQIMVYGFLTLLGIALPFSSFLPWIMENGINVELFFEQLFATPISSFFGWDVIISAVVLLTFIYSEYQENDAPKKIYPYALPMVGTCTIGVSCGLPLFLLLREIQKRDPQTSAR